jgi:RHS repeat-associated protein
LRKGQSGSAGYTLETVYTPDGVRIEKTRNWDEDDYHHKYIVDTAGKLPVILLVLDADDNNAILKRYIHANEQIIMQHDVVDNNKSYFYLHDRLGSVRQIMDSTASVKNCYTYDPWGLPVGDETSETFFNPYRFAGYFWDPEVAQYHCFRRQYDPVLGRFTSRDPVAGKFKEPMTLHRYLYCLNDPVNRTDPTGELLGMPTWAKLQAKIAGVGLAARLGVDRFVATLNLRAAWLDFKLSTMELKHLGIEGMVKVHNLFANVASYGWRAVAEAYTSIARWEAADPGGPAEVVEVLTGPPGALQSRSGMAALATRELYEELREEGPEFKEWYDENK